MKRYVRETQSDFVLRAMASDLAWAACAVAAVEAHLTLCARFGEPLAREAARRNLEVDWARFAVVPLQEVVLVRAIEIGCQTRIRTLDALHLAAAERLSSGVTLLTFDERQAAAARELGFTVAP